jgi:hypothetical protein
MEVRQMELIWYRIRMWIDDHKGVCLIVGSLLLIVLVWGYSVVRSWSNNAHQSRPSSVPLSEDVKFLLSQIEQAAGEGDWASVTKLIDKIRQLPGGGKEYLPHLEATGEIHFLLYQGRSSGQAGELILAKGDEYWLNITISAECYLYVLEHTSAGHLNLLFPNYAYSTFNNPVKYPPIRLPKNYSETFKMDEDKPGIYTIYILASLWPQKKLEVKLHQLSSEKAETRKEEIVEEILSMLKNAKEYTIWVPGLAYQELSYKYEYPQEKVRVIKPVRPKRPIVVLKPISPPIRGAGPPGQRVTGPPAPAAGVQVKQEPGQPAPGAGPPGQRVSGPPAPAAGVQVKQEPGQPAPPAGPTEMESQQEKPAPGAGPKQ